MWWLHAVVVVGKGVSYFITLHVHYLTWRITLLKNQRGPYAPASVILMLNSKPIILTEIDHWPKNVDSWVETEAPWIPARLCLTNRSNSHEAVEF